MTDRNSWNMASIASRRPLQRDRKMHGPVGPTVVHLVDRAGVLLNGVETSYSAWYACREKDCCRVCGYHVCSCERRHVPCATGSWPWAKEQLAAGHTVRRKAWEWIGTVVRQRVGGGYECKSRESYWPENWEGVDVDETEFVPTTDWELVPPEPTRDHGVPADDLALHTRLHEDERLRQERDEAKYRVGVGGE